MKYFIPAALLAAGLVASPVMTVQAQTGDQVETSEDEQNTRRGPPRGGPDGQGGGMGGPPVESLEVCAQAAENDTCSFEGRQGLVEGTCAASPVDDALICRPARRQQGARGGQGGGMGGPEQEDLTQD